MRTLTLAVVVLSGCSQVAGPVGPQGQAADVTALAAEVMALRAELGAIKREAPKQLHLVKKSTGEDLGLYVTRQAAWVEAVGDVMVVSTTGFLYAAKGCMGQPFAPSGPADYRVSPLGTIIKINDDPRRIDVRSVRAWDGCRDYPDDPNRLPQDGQTFIDTGIAFPVAPVDDVVLDAR